MNQGQSLRVLANALFEGGRLNPEDYYEFLVDAVVYMPVSKLDSGVAPAGLDIDGTHFGLLFMSPEYADSVVARTPFGNPEHLSARSALQRIPNGWGIIVGWSTSWELRITPDAVTELNERFGVRQAATEATEEWLSRLNNEFAGLPSTARVEHANREVATREWVSRGAGLPTRTMDRALLRCTCEWRCPVQGSMAE